MLFNANFTLFFCIVFILLHDVIVCRLDVAISRRLDFFGGKFYAIGLFFRASVQVSFASLHSHPDISAIFADYFIYDLDVFALFVGRETLKFCQSVRKPDVFFL
jgi:predicted membrane protein